MSGHKNAKKKDAVAEWRVQRAGFQSGGEVRVPLSRLSRDRLGGYIFTGPAGVVAAFAPADVAYVLRVEQAVPDDPGSLVLASGAEACTGP